MLIRWSFLGILGDHIVHAMEDYRAGDLYIQRGHGRPDTGTLCLDQLAHSILKGVRFFQSIGTHDGTYLASLEPPLQVVAPLFSHPPSPPPFNQGPAFSTPEDASIAEKHELYRDLVYQEAFQFVDNFLASPELWSEMKAYVDNPDPGQISWEPRIGPKEVHLLTGYMKELLGHPEIGGPLGILKVAPILCRTPPPSDGGADPDLHEFRTVWAALQDSGRFPIAPESEPDAPSLAEDEQS